MLNLNLPNFITVMIIVLLSVFVSRFGFKALGKNSPV